MIFQWASLTRRPPAERLNIRRGGKCDEYESRVELESLRCERPTLTLFTVRHELFICSPQRVLKTALSTLTQLHGQHNK